MENQPTYFAPTANPLEGVSVSPITPPAESGKVSVSKSDCTALVSALDALSAVAIEDFAHNVVIRSVGDALEFRWSNDHYVVWYSVAALSGGGLSAHSIPIATFKKLLSSADSVFTLVEQGDGLHVQYNSHLVFVNTTPFDPAWYSIDIGTDLPLLETTSRSVLSNFRAVMSHTERAQDRLIITHEGNSYIRTDYALGMSKSLFGSYSSVLSRAVIDSIAAFLGAFPNEDVYFRVGDGTAEFMVGNFVYMKFPLVTGERVNEFFIPMFRSAFDVKNPIQLDNVELARMLSVLKSLDYYSSYATLRFGRILLTISITRNDGGVDSFEFPYRSGGSTEGSVVVYTPILLSVLKRVASDASISIGDGCLVISDSECSFSLRTKVE